MDIIKQHKYHHMHLKEVDEEILKEHPLNIDSDSEELENNDVTNPVTTEINNSQPL
mgnify:CR=1 FL=1